MAQPIALKRKSPEFEDEHRKRGRESLAAFQKGASPTTVGTSSVEASATANPSVRRHDSGASGSDDVACPQPAMQHVRAAGARWPPNELAGVRSLKGFRAS